jgi:transglutaminase-like putative cysteine protease
MDPCGKNGVSVIKLLIEADLDYFVPEPANILLAIEAAPLPEQHLVEDRLIVDGVDGLSVVAGSDGVGRRTWMRGNGKYHAHYQAIVEVDRPVATMATLSVTPLKELEASVIPYLWPSRYCESDQLAAFVEREFGTLEGGAKVAAMADWIFASVDYRSGSSQGKTTAVDTFVSRQGVCRDFAHLMAAFARAADIPARTVSAYALGLNPPDFHAVVEVWLDGGWHLVDATRLARPESMVLIAAGRDATDIAFMTIFGTAQFVDQSVRVELAQ